MLRHGGLLLAVTTALAAGCDIDRVTWETTGFPVEEVTRTLVEEHHAQRPQVSCIKREVGGAVWACRAEAVGARFGCEVKVAPGKVVRELECERETSERG